jgi:hypothetical protein
MCYKNICVLYVLEHFNFFFEHMNNITGLTCVWLINVTNNSFLM